MVNWFGQLFGRVKQRTSQLQQEESDDSTVQDKSLQQVSPASIRSLLKTAINDAEQIATNIKMRAQKEAEAEATRIIAQAELEFQEIKGGAEIAAQREAEVILSAANRNVEIIEVEAKQQALHFLIKASEEVKKQVSEEYQRTYSRLSSFLQNLTSEGQNIETELSGRIVTLQNISFELNAYGAELLGSSQIVARPSEMLSRAEAELETKIASKEKAAEPVQLEEEAVEEKTAEPVQLEEETVEEKAAEPVQLEEETVEEKTAEPVQLEEETVEEKTAEPVQLEEEAVGEKTVEPVQLLNIQALYTGKVELVIATPMELKLVSRLYNYLQTVPELKVLYTMGSWDQGTSITVVLEKQMPLISIILETPGVEVTPVRLEKDGPARGKSSSLLRGEKDTTGGIKLILKEA